VHVTLVAQRGAEVGLRVFSTAAIDLPEEVNVVEQRPTPERVLGLLRESDHVFYTGHGIGGAQHGLVLTDERGNEVLLSTLELFGAEDIRGKKLVLSACETAHEPVLASAEPMSIAAALLQLGAGFLLASAWVAIDRIAAALCTTFHQHWVRNGWDPLQAFTSALSQVRASSNPTLSEWATFLPFIGVNASSSEMPSSP
jgi:CHAT domain-containing protein